MGKLDRRASEKECRERVMAERERERECIGRESE